MGADRYINFNSNSFKLGVRDTREIDVNTSRKMDKYAEIVINNNRAIISTPNINNEKVQYNSLTMSFEILKWVQN